MRATSWEALSLSSVLETLQLGPEVCFLDKLPESQGQGSKCDAAEAGAQADLGPHQVLVTLAPWPPYPVVSPFGEGRCPHGSDGTISVPTNSPSCKETPIPHSSSPDAVRWLTGRGNPHTCSLEWEHSVLTSSTSKLTRFLYVSILTWFLKYHRSRVYMCVCVVCAHVWACIYICWDQVSLLDKVQKYNFSKCLSAEQVICFLQCQSSQTRGAHGFPRVPLSAI